MSSFGANLMHRRVPQIVGLYIAAMWMAVEIGDWVTERFGFSDSLTSYLFLGMAVLLPSVALLAYGHGAPGRDRWTRAQKLLVPVNVMAAAVALFIFQPGREAVAVAAVETMTMMDDEGVERTFTVAKTAQVKRVYVAFIDNATGSDGNEWLQQGIPWLLEADLDQNIFVNVVTPFWTSIAQALKQDGFADGSDVPLSLTLGNARKRNAHLVVDGAVTLDGDQTRVTVQLYDPSTSEQIGELSAAGQDILAIVDDLSRSLVDTLEVPELPKRLRSDLPVREFVSDSLAAIESTVKGQIAARYDNDFVKAIEFNAAAVELDSTFALALTHLAVARYLTGELPAANELMKRALALDYKLSEDSRFKLKALSYETAGQTEKMLKVAQLWTEVSPTNADAWSMLATVLKFQGNRYEETLEAFQRQYELDPNNSVLKEIAATEIVLGRRKEARVRLQRYLEQEPTDANAIAQLASLSALEGDFDGARSALERGALISSSATKSELGIVDLDIREGQFDIARNKLDALSANQLSGLEQIQLLNLKVRLASLEGRFGDALLMVNEAEPLLRQLLPPIQVVFSVGFSRVQLLALVGKFDEGLAAVEEMQSQLQGPLRTMANMGALLVRAIEASVPELTQSLEETKAAMADIQAPPMMLSLIDAAEASLLEAQGDFVGAAEQNQLALVSVRQFALLTGDAGQLAQLESDTARSLLLADQHEQARALLDSIFTYFPSYAPALLELAFYQKTTGDTEGAQATLNDLLARWANADPEYIGYQRAIDLASELGMPVARL